jgi:carboxyl-terminal processing protease
MNFKKRTGVSLVSIFILILSAGWLWDQIQAKGDDFYESIIRFDDILRKIKTHYVVDVPAESLIVYAVDGMRDILDPHTNYFEKNQYDDLMVRTKGEFGGLGITIGMTDKILTVIAPLPIPNSPAMKAGLLSGDRIVKIDGKSTRGIKLDEAVQKLRGKPGTHVTITIDREGVRDPFDVEIERDIIRVHSVPYDAMIDKKNRIGYIKLATFTQVSDREVEDAVRELSGKGMKALIFDLRDNPGGLLKQAVTVAEKFLPAGLTMVYTQGRSASSKTIFKSSSKPVLDRNVRLLVLVNQGSASASEIVAGAIQDHDRGVILGNETYGKGSVQTILPLEKKRALKLTTAYYYTPSGRCINKLSNDVGVKRHEMEAEIKKLEGKGPDQEGSDTAQVKKKAFKTLNLGRTVYGGGGITPDVTVKRERYTPLEINLARNRLFFKFAVAEIAKIRKKNRSVREKTFKIDKRIYAAFMAYLKEAEFEYTSPEEDLLKELGEIVARNRQDPADTAKTISGPNDKAIDRKIEDLRKSITADKHYAFTRNKAIVKDRLMQSFMAAGVSQDAYYRYVLKKDRYVNEAVKLLLDSKKYASILAGNYKKKPN